MQATEFAELVRPITEKALQDGDGFMVFFNSSDPNCDRGGYNQAHLGNMEGLVVILLLITQLNLMKIPPPMLVAMAHEALDVVKGMTPTEDKDTDWAEFLEVLGGTKDGSKKDAGD